MHNKKHLRLNPIKDLKNQLRNNTLKNQLINNMWRCVDSEFTYSIWYQIKTSLYEELGDKELNLIDNIMDQLKYE
jgi:hypothetical protein